MGCATSKQKVCRNCQAPFSPVPRSYSMHVHHLPQAEGDSYHMVALTSSTLGTLKLDPLHTNHYVKEDLAPAENGSANEAEKISKDDFAMGMIEAKTWSRMIEEKIPKIVPKTPTKTPPGEPETINAWELMEGLEDTSPLRLANHHFRSFSFHVAANSNPSYYDPSTPKVKENGDQTTKPIWLESEMADDSSNLDADATSVISEFDPEVISTFRKALEELPPANPFHLKSLINEKDQALVSRLDAELEASDEKKVNGIVEEYKYVPRGKEKVVFYFTSLRGVRKTYEDCCQVRVILKGLGIKVDERDVSMHSGFKEEVKELLGEGYTGGGLPKVFVGRKFIGGAEEIKQMHESGQLEKVVESCEKVDDGGGGGGNGGVCEACGDIRFVPCDTCSGSCRVYYEGDYHEDEEENEEDEYGFQRCPDCNENGLIRCPICCD